MPHLIIEYSKSVKEHINIKTLLSQLHQVTINSNLFKIMDVKTRAIEVQDWLVGEQEVDFIHVSCAILEGRTEIQKVQLSKCLFDTLKTLEFTCSITVEIREIDIKSFHKFLLY